MGTHVVKVPDIGEGIAEVELIEWHVKPGDAVSEEQILVDVMTDKASVEIPSPVAGKVLAISGKPGDTIAVGSELIRLEVEGAGNIAASTAAEPAARPPEPKPAPAPAAVEPKRVPEPAAQTRAVSAPRPAPSAAAAPAPLPRAPEERPIASPAVRRRAWDLGIDLRVVHGSGPGGRIMHDDLDAHLAAGGQVSTVARGSQLRERNDETVVPVIGLRRQIARKMQQSKRHIPHFTYVEEIDVTELEALRTRLNVKWQGTRGHLTLLPFLMWDPLESTCRHASLSIL